MGEIVNQLQHSPPNTFPSNTITNPKKECKAISVKMVEETPRKEQEAVVGKEQQKIITPSPQLPRVHDKPLSKFLEVFACLEVNIPLLRSLKEIPVYVKSMK
ncbi:hypothetical protein PIB30_079831 [Stylosanthes scabra]|uniref:Reverse transcriptase domain-containing protein n=1 Tax=Stylosanthes scabra TaxID=79078 RepID=A0ABU6QRE3_9FABA|nr:hypothetical protein [Stylosanthes scabra]